MIDEPITPRPLTDPLANARRILADPEIVLASNEWRKLVGELVEETRESIASRLIDAWCEAHSKQIPWSKAVQIVGIVTNQPQAEQDRLLHLSDDDNGQCPMCGRSDA